MKTVYTVTAMQNQIFVRSKRIFGWILLNAQWQLFQVEGIGYMNNGWGHENTYFKRQNVWQRRSRALYRLLLFHFFVYIEHGYTRPTSDISNTGFIPSCDCKNMENSLFWTMKDVFIIQIPCLIIPHLWISYNRWSECANIKVLIILYQSYLSFWSVKYSGKFINYLKSLECAFFNKVLVNVLQLKRFKTQSNK